MVLVTLFFLKNWMKQPCKKSRKGQRFCLHSIKMSFFNLLPRRKLSNSMVSHAIQNVTVIGAGLMGCGIAQVAAQTGHNVILVDQDQNALRKANKRIENSLLQVVKKKFGEDKEASEKFISETKSSLFSTTDVVESAKSADIIIESIVEKLDAKQKLFSQLDKVASASTIFVSNTSSLRISNIAEATKRKTNFGGLHFFNPVPYMKLLEVIRTAETSVETLESLILFGAALEKQTVTCKDTPGFIVNRFLIPLCAESIRMMERGDALPQDIDTAMKLGAGHVIGPIALADYVGLDVLKDIYTGMEREFPDNPVFKTPYLIKQLVKEGKFGCKTGEGFYKY